MAVLLLLCLCGFKIRAAAESGSSIGIEAELLPGGDGSTYDIRVTLQNNGSDWEGTARLILKRRYSSAGCAYDTALSLPAGSRKQFTVKVPVQSMTDKSGTVSVILLDKSGKQTANRDYERLLKDEADAVSMGILSDSYQSLTYLDMGGMELDYYNDKYPVRLIELNQDKLLDSLDTLAILVIDRYSTEVLTTEELEAIQAWNEDGGILIVGTGAYAEDTLGGFDQDYIGVVSTGVYPPGTDRPAAGYGNPPGADRPAAEYGNPSNLLEATLDTSQITLAELQALLPQYSEPYRSGGCVCYWGRGAIAVLPFSLAELGELDADKFYDSDRTEFIYNVLDEVTYYSEMKHGTAMGGYDLTYTWLRLFSVLGNSDNVLNFSVLKVIVILYVIFVGPVLYLILKCFKKRELYWVAVPAAALLGIWLVYVAGRGFEVTDTKVYSVTVEGLEGADQKDAYLMCYDAGHSEWGLKLSDDYEYAGPIENNYYYSGQDDDDYYWHVLKDGNGLYFGIKPTASFETCQFRASGAGTGGKPGDVELDDVRYIGYGGAQLQELDGTVVNGTENDFSCFALIADGTMYVYGALPAGESRNLAELAPFYTGMPVYEDDYSDYTNWVRNLNGKEEYKEQIDILAAVGLGLCGVADQAESADVFFMGVVEDYDRAVDDVCSEVSYGCLYKAR